MARYKEYSYDQTMMIPVSFKNQILPGTFEYKLCHLIDAQIDMSVFEDHYINDKTGAPQVFVKQKTLRKPNIRHYTYDPSILLKIVLYAYSKGINSSRKIEKLCQKNIVCMALAADTRPHFTTIADFISSSHKGGWSALHYYLCSVKSKYDPIFLIYAGADLEILDLFGSNQERDEFYFIYEFSSI